MINIRDPMLAAPATGLSDGRTEHPFNLRRAVERFEQKFLQNILVLVDGDQPQAAEMLGISLADLQEKMTYYEMEH